jgi:hypothetical protein
MAELKLIRRATRPTLRFDERSKVAGQTVPLETAHLPGRLRELGPWDSLHSAPVRCSAGFARLLLPQPLLSRPACGFVGLVTDDYRLGREPHHR